MDALIGNKATWKGDLSYTSTYYYKKRYINPISMPKKDAYKVFIPKINLMDSSETKPYKLRGNHFSVFKKMVYDEGNKNLVDYSEVEVDVGGEIYVLPKPLKPIVNQIEEAKEILEYPADWDGEGALPTHKNTFNKAATNVIKYALWIYNNYGVVTEVPYIDILKDGGISVHWETEKAQMLIIFKNDEEVESKEELAYFYAEIKENKIPLKSAIRPNAPVDELIALWIKKNLT